MTASAAEDSPAVCAPCHRSETARSGRGMAGALQTGRSSAILRANPKLTTKLGGYSYEISRAGDDAIYTVTDGKETIRVSLDWAFGHGAVGQTYLFQRDGNWYESRVSYYSALRGLDATMGMQTLPVHNLQEAAGRLIGPEEARRCFDCHATNVANTPKPLLSTMIEGVQCERCHGASEAHLRAASHPMPKLGALTTEEMSDFCGQCHRTWSQIATSGPRGIQNVRFQPYRLGNSKCYDPDDRRIRCTACHDPHRDVETSAGAYDSKCRGCHSLGGSRRRAASKICQGCHERLRHVPHGENRFA